jgi:DNA-binding GntR family transcriptional regulator
MFQSNHPNTPILVVEDIGYDEEDNPVFFSYEFLVKDASDFHVIRYVGNI